MGFRNQLFSLFGITILENYSMSLKTGYPVGGPADYFVTVYSVKALKDVVELCVEKGVSYKILGNGTNVVFSDKGYKGVVISVKGLNTISHNNGIITAMCGVSLCDLVLFSAEYNLYGAETLIGIPATVGGAVVMNAGAFGKSISQFVSGVTTIKDGKLKYYHNHDCNFEYRQSVFLGNNEPIVSVDFIFEKQTLPTTYQIEDIIERCKQRRMSNQPTGRSCGCIFKNPQGDYAGRIIESANLKGQSVGLATVSQKHANFIIVQKGATAQQIYQLVQLIKQRVKNEFGISLVEEVEFVGEF